MGWRNLDWQINVVKMKATADSSFSPGAQVLERIYRIIPTFPKGVGIRISISVSHWMRDGCTPMGVLPLLGWGQFPGQGSESFQSKTRPEVGGVRASVLMRELGGLKWHLQHSTSCTIQVLVIHIQSRIPYQKGSILRNGSLDDFIIVQTS